MVEIQRHPQLTIRREHGRGEFRSSLGHQRVSDWRSSPSPAMSRVGRGRDHHSMGALIWPRHRCVSATRELTRGLAWDPTYVTHEQLYPYTRFEGIKIHDWDEWEDPFRLTVDAYCEVSGGKGQAALRGAGLLRAGAGSPAATDARVLQLDAAVHPGRDTRWSTQHTAISLFSRVISTARDRDSRRYVRASTSCATTRPRPTRSSMYNKYYDGFAQPERCTTGSGISACRSRSSTTACRRARSSS